MSLFKNLLSLTYNPHKNPPSHVHTSSNHPPQIIKTLPALVDKHFRKSVKLRKIFKGIASGLRQFWANEHFKNDGKCFLFHLKSSFCCRSIDRERERREERGERREERGERREERGERREERGERREERGERREERGERRERERESNHDEKNYIFEKIFSTHVFISSLHLHFS